MLDAGVRSAWVMAVEAGTSAVESAEEARFEDLAEAVYRAFESGRHIRPTPWNQMLPHVRLIWEGIVRQLVRLLLVDLEEESLDQVLALEDEIKDWYEQKVNEL